MQQLSVPTILFGLLVALPTPNLSQDAYKVPDMDGTIDDPLKITIIYDNYAYRPEMATEWGFAALIEFQGEKVLLDTGSDIQRLTGNSSILGIDLSHITHVLLTHEHGDHTGGLSGFIAQLADDIRPNIYMLPSFPANLKRLPADKADVVEVTPWQMISTDIYTTGEVRGPVNEQALVVTTDVGLVIVTGCAHPGIVNIVERAKEHFQRDVYQVIGGFHLGGKPSSELESIVADFRRLGVRKVTPTHCTGDEAIAAFRDEYGDDYIQGGAGRVIVIEP